MSRPRVVIESPFAGDVSTHVVYLLRALRHSTLEMGENPYASHLFFPLFLNDSDPREREIGIACGLSWGGAAEKAIFYVDYGMSPGMVLALDFHTKVWVREVEERRIGQNPVEFEGCVTKELLGAVYAHVLGRHR